MAVLSKIRERSLFLIVIIGLALFAFVLDPSKIGDFLNSSKVNEIGEVDGEAISNQEFAEAVETYKKQVGGRITDMQASNTVWDNLVRKKIYENQLAEAGVTVGQEDVLNELAKDPSIQQNPQYLNEIGLFDMNKFKQFLVDTQANNSQFYAQWQTYINSVKSRVENNTFNNLVTAGLGATLKEGENAYMIEGTKMDAEYVYIPYSSIADNLVTVSDAEIQSYINNNPEDYKVEATRDVSYVEFKVEATSDDEQAIIAELKELVEDNENGILGLRNDANTADFFAENSSDTPLDENFKFKNQVNQVIANELFSQKIGDVYGPYKDNGFFKVSKVLEVAQLPDSVKASHILIPFLGVQGAGADVTQTEEQAKKTADSLVKVIKRRKSKFAALAKTFSSDTSNKDKAGELDWFGYTKMAPEFRDFSFTNKKRAIGVIKTAFGFHIIKIENQKNFQKTFKLATFSRKIIASEATEAVVYRNAEQFTLDLAKATDIYEAATKSSYVTKPGFGLTVMNEEIPGLGNQREIVSWAFGKEVVPGDYKRFEIDGGHAVVFVTNRTEKGLMSLARVANRVKPILMNEKKAAMITAKMNGNSLQEIATANQVSSLKATGLNMVSPTLSGVGNEPKVVGAMYLVAKNKLFNKVVGDNGVFAFVVTNRELPTALPNYQAKRNEIAGQRRNATFKIYEAIKKASNVEDNRGNLYIK